MLSSLANEDAAAYRAFLRRPSAWSRRHRRANDAGAAKALSKAVSLPGRITSLEAMSRTLVNLTKLEREAFGIDNKAKEASPLEKLMREIKAVEGAA